MTQKHSELLVLAALATGFSSAFRIILEVAAAFMAALPTCLDGKFVIA